MERSVSKCLEVATIANEVQIEKFVESIYPTQTAEAAILAQKGQLTEDAEKRRKDEAEARSDTMFMLFAVFGVLLFVSGLMVSCVIAGVLIGMTGY